MVDWGLADLVALCLAESEREGEAKGPRGVTAREISEVLADDGSLARRVALFSALEQLERDGVVRERVDDGGTDGNGPRTVYELTDAGRERAASFRETLLDQRISVRNGIDREVELAEIGEYVEEPAIPRALARSTEDGVLFLQEDREEFVGREAELEALLTGYRRVEDGGSDAVLVSGPTGAGKTTLVTEAFSGRVRDRDGRVVVGNCREDSGEPHAGFREVLDELSGEAGATPLRSGGGSDPADAEDYEAARTEMFESVASRIRAAADRPLVVVVEDVEAAHESTVALFEHLVAAELPGVMLVATADGSTEGHDLESLAGDGDSAPRHVELGPLDVDETERLIRAVTGHPEVPDAFVGLVYDRTGGNPLFVEELVTRAVAEGAADPAHGVFPTDPGEMPLPETVEDVVDRRLAVLDERTGSVLDVAALVGDAVPWPVLADSVSIPVHELRTAVDLLVDARVFDREDDGTVRFVSGLVRHVAADRVSDDRRAAIHRRLAEAWETHAVDDLERHAAVARHRREAGDLERAFEAYREAGDLAVDAYAAETARQWFETALDIARSELDWRDGDERILAVLKRLSECHRLLDDYESADRYLQYVAERTDDPDRVRSVAADRAELWRDRGDFDRATSIVEDAVDEVGTDSTQGSVALLKVRGEVRTKRQAFDAAAEDFDRALEIAEGLGEDETGEEDLVWNLRKNRDYIDMERGTVDEGTVETWREAVERARGDDDNLLGDMLTNLGITAIHHGDLELAREALTESVAVYDRIGLDMQVCDSRNTLGAALTYAGELEAAMEQYEMAIETARALDHDRVVSYTYNNMASVRRLTGDFERAIEYYERALERSRDLDTPQFWTTQSLSLANMTVYRDDPARARELAEEVLDAATDLGMVAHQVGALTVAGHASRIEGDPHGAIERYERALELLEEHDVEDVPQTALGLYLGVSEARLELDDPDGALEAAETAGEAAKVQSVPRSEDFRLRSRAAVATVHRTLGNTGEARRILEEVAEAAGNEWPVTAAVVAYERGLLARDLGLESIAVDRFERALDDAESLGFELLARRCRVALDADR